MHKERWGPRAPGQTTDLDRALGGADYVLVAISTGGSLHAARPGMQKVRHPRPSATRAPAGLAPCAACRCSIAWPGDARHCPDAWMLNLTGPSALTRTVTATGSRLGVPRHLGVARSYPVLRRAGVATAYVSSGIDHCAWFAHGRRRRDARRSTEARAGRVALPPHRRPNRTRPLRRSPGCGWASWSRGTSASCRPSAAPDQFLPTFLRGDNVSAELVRTIADRQATMTASGPRSGACSPASAPRRGRPTDVLGERQADDVGSWIAALEGKTLVGDKRTYEHRPGPQLPLGHRRDRGVLDRTGFHRWPAAAAQLERSCARTPAREMTIDAALEDFDKALAVLVTDPLLVRPDDAARCSRR